MKTLFRLLTLLLCVELIVSPVAPQMSFIGQTMAEEGSCEKGFNWDSTLNRCLTSTETANVMNAVASCSAGDVQCYRTNAESALKTAESNGDVSKAVVNKGGMATAMNAAAVAVPLTMASYVLMTREKDSNGKSDCKPYSLYAMVAAGTALFAGDVLANMGHKKRLKEIQKDWDKIINEGAEDATNSDVKKTNATEAQSQAFEMLARSEDSMAKAAKMKAGFNATAMAAFAAVAAWSTYETITLAMAKARMSQDGGTEYYRLYKKYTCTTHTDQKITQENARITDKLQQENMATGATKAQESMDGLGQKTVDEMKVIERQIPAPTTTPAPSSGGAGGTTGRMIFWNSYSNRITQSNIRSAPNLASWYVLNEHLDKVDHNFSSPSIDEYNQISNYLSNYDLDEDKDLLQLFKDTAVTLRSNILPLSNAVANDGGSSNEGLAQIAMNGMRTMAGKAKSTVQSIGKHLKTPITRAVVSGVFAGWAGVMYSYAKKQKEASEERAKMLRKMKEEFNIASGAINMCSAEDRSNTGKPECYCYTSEGQRNSNRTNSAICQKLWTGIDTTAGNYFGSTDTSTKGCIASSGTFDSTCSCKANNSCLKASGNGGITGLSTGTFSMLSSPLKAIDNLGNGSTDAASINGDAAVSNAMRIMDATKKLQNSKGAEEVKKAQAGAKALENSLITGASGVNPGLASNSSSGLAGLSAKDAAAMLEKELNENTIGGVSGNAGTISTDQSNGGETPQLDFGMTTDQFNNQEGQVAEVMKESFDYGTNDINEGSKTNIFEVLSNRYQRSGMRRLFDEKSKTQAEAPAKTDISN